ncbi:hypothetical protein BDV95DRAFT_651529 [Massariosphaeria phaeospora]|uniref:Uncharacterized protein n=1 Tax=Massariosphaeria phaeospora TaxID=100035 RepID=A0A7C8HZ88_9PLEO|nr:hypothetical protein BDV95DRAFT_651529 [Massariosphaeria phaeospora]
MPGRGAVCARSEDALLLGQGEVCASSHDALPVALLSLQHFENHLPQSISAFSHLLPASRERILLSFSFSFFGLHFDLERPINCHELRNTASGATATPTPRPDPNLRTTLEPYTPNSIKRSLTMCRQKLETGRDCVLEVPTAETGPKLKGDMISIAHLMSHGRIVTEPICVPVDDYYVTCEKYLSRRPRHHCEEGAGLILFTTSFSEIKAMPGKWLNFKPPIRCEHKDKGEPGVRTVQSLCCHCIVGAGPVPGSNRQ